MGAAALVLVCRTVRALLLSPLLSSAARGVRLAGLAASLRPGGSGSLVLAYLLHWLPYATQDRQTFLLYYLPAYYFAILLLGRAWHECVCAFVRPPIALCATLALGGAAAHVSWQLAPLAYGAPVRLHEWTSALRLASTECWPSLGESACWVDARME